MLFLVSADECHTGTFWFDVDLLETSFASLMASCPQDPLALRLATDDHFNAEGQRWLAAAILEFLESDVLPDP